jgi:general secretion pathway protein G
VARGGFTLMEILVVVAIIVVLAGVGVAYLLPQVDVAKEGVAKTQLRTLTNQCQAYYLRNNSWPPSLEALAMAQPSGDPPLMPADQLVDPWQHPFVYDPSGARNGGMNPDISTHTPNGKEIGNWPGGH